MGPTGSEDELEDLEDGDGELWPAVGAVEPVAVCAGSVRPEVVVNPDPPVEVSLSPMSVVV